MNRSGYNDSLVRRNSTERFKGSKARNGIILGHIDSYDKWEWRYGLMWVTEAVFSSIERMFGGYVVAKKMEDVIRGMTLKISLYNLLLGIT